MHAPVITPLFPDHLGLSEGSTQHEIALASLETSGLVSTVHDSVDSILADVVVSPLFPAQDMLIAEQAPLFAGFSVEEAA